MTPTIFQFGTESLVFSNEKQLREMAETKDNNSKLLLPGIIQQIVEKQSRGRPVAPGSDDERCLALEIEELFTQRKRASETLNALFPEGISPSIVFFNKTNDLHLRLGYSEISHRLTGLLLLLAIEQLPEDSGEALLREIPNIASPHFFTALDSLSTLAAERELRPGFVAEWFPALVRRIGNDMASGGFWKALAIYCDQHPKNSLEVLQYLTKAQNEEQISVAAFILGAMRSFDLDELMLSQFKKLESEFSNGVTIGVRSIYNRSWIETSRRGKMRQADLEMLINYMRSEERRVGKECW